MKGIVDGVICTFQAHTDKAVLREVAERIAEALGADPAEIEELLLDQLWAVLGAVPRLVSIYGKGVKWDPADHWCVAGDLLVAEPVGPRWAIRVRSSSSPADTADPPRCSKRPRLGLSTRHGY